MGWHNAKKVKNRVHPRPLLGVSPSRATRLKLHFANLGKRHSHTAEAKRKIAAASKKRWSDPAFHDRVAIKIATANRKLTKRRKQSKTERFQFLMGTRKRAFKHPYFHSGWISTQKAGKIYCHSGWEKLRAKQLDDDSEVVTYVREPIRLLYQLRGTTRVYFPDFSVAYIDGTIVLEEVKGPIPDKEMWRQKQKVGKTFCRKRGFEFRVVDSKKLLRVA
jgi:hypothetical protein